MCAKNHLMGIMLNGELVSSVNVVCGKLQNITMPRSAFLEGRNPLKFSTAYGPFMVRNVSVRVNFDNSAPITQEFDNFVIESVKRTIELASKNQVTMMNYYDQPFTVSEREFPGDFKATLDSDRDGLIVIYLNGKRIFDGEVSKGKFSVNLPKDDISLGSNRIRYIILP
jgi:hypothetical protein